MALPFPEIASDPGLLRKRFVSTKTRGAVSARALHTVQPSGFPPALAVNAVCWKCKDAAAAAHDHTTRSPFFIRQSSTQFIGRAVLVAEPPVGGRIVGEALGARVPFEQTAGTMRDVAD